MDKFYITCGEFTFLTTATDERSAALWAVHHFLSTRVDLGTIEWSDPETIDRDDLIEAMLSLDEQVCVSEIGFGRADAATFDAADILTEWNQLAIAIQRLEALLD